MAQFEAISEGVLEVTRTTRGGYPPLVVGLGALGRARVSQEQEQGEAEGEDAAYEEVPTDGGPYDESLILAEGLDEETPHRIEAYVKQEHGAAFHTLAEAAGDPGRG